MSQTVAVIGGGISGLSAAWELVSSAPDGTRIVVFEAAARAGGNLRSEIVGDRRLDVAADAFLARRPEAVELCAQLGISGDLVTPGTSSASVWARGALRRLPDGLVLGVPTRLLPLARSRIVSATGVARAAADLAVPARRDRSVNPADRSVGDIVGARLGHQVRDLLAGPLVGGINAGRVDALSAEVVFPDLLHASRRGGSLMKALRRGRRPTRAGSGAPTVPPASTGGPPMVRPPTALPLTARPPGEAPVFLAPSSGMSSLPDALCGALRSKGVDVRTSAPVALLEESGGGWVLAVGAEELRADGVVIALPARPACEVLGKVDAPLARMLEGLRAASVALVVFRFAAHDVGHDLEGSGFLVPASLGPATWQAAASVTGLVTACTFFSNKWPHLAVPGEVLLRVSAGRDGDDRAASLDDGELTRVMLGELDRMIGPLGEPQQMVVSRFPGSFPQYDVGHLARVADIEAEAARVPALGLAGAAYRGVGVPACIGSGRRAARLVAEKLGWPEPRPGPGRPSDAPVTPVAPA